MIVFIIFYDVYQRTLQQNASIAPTHHHSMKILQLQLHVVFFCSQIFHRLRVRAYIKWINLYEYFLRPERTREREFNDYFCLYPKKNTTLIILIFNNNFELIISSQSFIKKIKNIAILEIHTLESKMEKFNDMH